MNFHLYRHRKISDILIIPEGLENLMTDIAREVIRYQPVHIESFIADYLEAMVVAREEIFVVEKTIDDILASTIHIEEMRLKIGLTMQQSVSVSEIIKNEFKNQSIPALDSKGFEEIKIINCLIKKCNLNTEQARKISGIIESAWHHYYNQNKNCFRVIPKVSNHNQVIQNTFKSYEKKFKSNQTRFRSTSKKFPQTENSMTLQAYWMTPNFQQRENASIKIQSWFRGESSRQHLKQRNIAASKIQNFYKTFLVRKQLKVQHQAAKVIQAFFRDYKMRQASLKKN